MKKKNKRKTDWKENYYYLILLHALILQSILIIATTVYITSKGAPPKIMIGLTATLILTTIWLIFQPLLTKKEQ